MNLVKSITGCLVLLLTLTSCGGTDTSSDTPNTTGGTSNSNSQAQTVELSQEEIRAKYQSDMVKYFAESNNMEDALNQNTPEECIVSLEKLADSMGKISSLTPPDDLYELHEEYKGIVLGLAGRFQTMADVFQEYVDGKLSDEQLSEEMEGFLLTIYLTAELCQETEETLLMELGIS